MIGYTDHKLPHGCGTQCVVCQATQIISMLVRVWNLLICIISGYSVPHVISAKNKALKKLSLFIITQIRTYVPGLNISM
jgi:hypothetical protein